MANGGGSSRGSVSDYGGEDPGSDLCCGLGFYPLHYFLNFSQRSCVLIKVFAYAVKSEYIAKVCCLVEKGSICTKWALKTVAFNKTAFNVKKE